MEFHYIVGRERHTEEGEGTPYHLHVYLEYLRPKRVRDRRFYDIEDFHPNIQSVRNPRACQDYCTKGGDYIANMELATIRRTYGEIIAGARSEEEFLVLLEESYPRDVVLNLERIQKYARHKWARPRDAFTTDYTGFVVPECLEQWYEENVMPRAEDGEQGGR